MKKQSEQEHKKKFHVSVVQYNGKKMCVALATLFFLLIREITKCAARAKFFLLIREKSVLHVQSCFFAN